MGPQACGVTPSGGQQQMAFGNKVFISYSRTDLAWAEKIHDRLQLDGFSSFWDRDSLRAGDDWEEKILENLKASQHLVVLMSKDAAKSDWVRREYSHFDALINTVKSGPEQLNRRLIFVLLDNDDVAFNRAQKITDFKLENPAVFPGPVDTVVGTPLWDRVIRQIEDSLRADPNTIPVSLGVLAMTRDNLDLYYDKNIKGFATKVNAALSRIGIPIDANSIEDFKGRYGNTPADWKPLDGKQRVIDLLEGIKTRLNNNIEAEGKRIRWEPIGPKFYQEDQAEITTELNKLREASTVFVVDPVSLYDADMVVKLGLLTERFENDRTVFLVLPPTIPHGYYELMEMVKNSANAFFNFFYDSTVRRRYANCCANVCDPRDIGRMLRATLGPHVYLDSSGVTQVSFG
jgi:TIR domain-containing protein